MGLTIDIKKVNDTIYILYNNEVIGDLDKVQPLDELKTLETLIKALKIFEDTKLYYPIRRQIELRLARLLAKFATLGDNNGST